MILFILFLQFLGPLCVYPRAVQAEVETSFVFGPEEVKKHESVVSNIEVLLQRLQKNFRRSQNLNGELTKFFLNFGGKFVQQNDDYIRNFTDMLAFTAEDYYIRQELSPLFSDDIALLTYVIDNSLHKWHLLSVQDIRKNVKETLKSDDTIFHKIISFADRFFNESDRKAFEDITADLIGGNGEKKDLDKTIKDTVDFIIFNRFKRLDIVTKVLLQNEIKQLINGYNNVTDIEKPELKSVVKVDKEEAPEIHKKDSKDKKYTNVDKNEALKEITEDLERIKRRHLNEKKADLNIEEKIKKEGEILLKHVEKELKKEIQA